MKSKVARSVAPSGVPYAVLKGTMASLGITVLGAMLMSWLILRETLKETAIGYSAMGILLLSSLIGASVSSGKMESKRMITSALTGCVYAVILLIANALLYKGGYEGVGATLLIVFGGSIAADILNPGHGKRTGSSKRRRKHR